MHSQTTDTICLPVSVAKKVLTAASEKPVLEEKIKLLQSDTSLLAQRSESKQRQINLLELTNENNIGIIRALNDQILLMAEEKKVFKDQLGSYEKLLRREKRKRVLTGVAGFITTGLTAILLIKK